MTRPRSDAGAGKSRRREEGRPAPSQRFRDRREAGRLLGQELARLGEAGPFLVLAIPRGGVPVAFEVALALEAPLDLVLVRKLGHPQQPELAIGAITSGGSLVLNAELAETVPETEVLEIARRELAEVRRRESFYRRGRAAEDPAGKVVVLVDDGLATGSSMRAAIDSVRGQSPARIIAAVPVAPPSGLKAIAGLVERSVAILQPRLFFGVGQWYDDFSQISEDEVRDLLAEAAARDGDRH